jgi:hypothetical protein
MSTARRNFVFDTERDQDLLTALDAMRDGEKSQAVRAGLRLHLQMPGDIRTQLALLVRSVSRLYASVEELRTELDNLSRRRLMVSSSVDDEEDDEFTDMLLGIGA